MVIYANILHLMIKVNNSFAFLMKLSGGAYQIIAFVSYKIAII
jgi:hypothetical protein